MMKKLLTLVTALIFSFVSLTQANAASFQTKKDGTADKRFKANKTSKGPLKKDGSADMRYKSNKQAPPTTTTKPSTPSAKAKKPKM